jgi:hypothetical protein
MLNPQGTSPKAKPIEAVAAADKDVSATLQARLKL